MKLFTEQITLDEMRSEIKREIAMRQKVYPNWILNGKISERTAAERILILQAIEILIYEEIKKNNPQGGLFG